MKNVLDEEKIAQTIEKMKLYKKEEDLCFDSLSQSLKSVHPFYQTSNTDLLEEMELEINEKMKTIQDLHTSAINVLHTNLVKYNETKRNVEKLFDHLS